MPLDIDAKKEENYIKNVRIVTDSQAVLYWLMCVYLI